MVRNGLNNIADNERLITVKGVAEKEVKADKVIWPVAFREVGNELYYLSNNVTTKNNLIVEFLKSNGIPAADITVTPPDILDTQAEPHMVNRPWYRYAVTSVVTVTSTDVDKVISLMLEQGTLLRQGVSLAGNNHKYKTTYEYSDMQSLELELITGAVNNAYAVADKLAQDTGSKLSKVKDITHEFTLTDRDPNSSYIKRARIVSTVNYKLKN